MPIMTSELGMFSNCDGPTKMKEIAMNRLAKIIVSRLSMHLGMNYTLKVDIMYAMAMIEKKSATPVGPRSNCINLSAKIGS